MNSFSLFLAFPSMGSRWFKWNHLVRALSKPSDRVVVAGGGEEECNARSTGVVSCPGATGDGLQLHPMWIMGVGKMRQNFAESITVAQQSHPLTFAGGKKSFQLWVLEVRSIVSQGGGEDFVRSLTLPGKPCTRVLSLAIVASKQHGGIAFP